MTAGTSTTNTSKRLRDLLQHVDDDQLVLPEIQREFVWTRKAVKLLFDSRDWKFRDVKLDGTVSGHGAQLQVHHARQARDVSNGTNLEL